jgi:hypothetical protein
LIMLGFHYLMPLVELFHGFIKMVQAQDIWRAPKSLVEPTWGFNYVELRKVGTWGPFPTSSTKRG